jgi:hypothetical protein
VSRAGRLAADSAEHWRAGRAGLKRRRHLLTQAAGRLYPDAARVGTTTLLCRPEWIPARPLGLDEVRLTKHLFDRVHPPSPACNRP